MKEDRRIIIEHYILAYNNFDVSGMMRDLHEDIVFENIANGELNLCSKGVAEFKNQAELAKEYFQERRQTIKSWSFNNDIVKVEIEYNAILAKEFPNGLKAGDALQLKGYSQFKFDKDKIIKITDES